MLVRLAAAAAALLALPPAAAAQLSKVETAGMRLVYISPSEDFLVPHAARTFLNADTFLKALFTYHPDEPVTLLLADFSDFGNAGATSVPRNGIRVQIAPLSFAFETITAGERMSTIMNHELVHVIAMDQAADRDRLFRRLFGGKVNPVAEQPESVLYFYLTTPRVAAPRWYHEGVAVFVDTWESGGLGRAQGGYDEMVFRAMVRDGSRFYDPLGLVAEGTRIDFQTEVNSYLYGGRFVTWLAHVYSPDHVVRWVSRTPGSRPYFASQFRQVFGTPIDEAWARWVAFERTFQETNLAAIRAYPVTPFEDLSPTALGSVSRAYLDAAGRTIYAGFNYPGTVAHVGSISLDSGDTRRLVDIKGPMIYQVTSLARDTETGTLFYTTDNLAHRDLMRLDPVTNETRVLMKDLRVGDLVMNGTDRSLWGIRVLNGLCSLVRLEAPYDDWERIVTFPYGTVVYDLDMSPDGTLISASFGEISGRQSVRIMSMDRLRAATPDPTPVAEFDLGGTVPNGFVFSPDGRYLYGSSYFTGVSNIFRYELATREVEVVTNAETGFFRPIPLGNDELIVFRYSGEGFVPARLTATPIENVGAITFLGERVVDRHPALKSWALGSPAAVAYDAMPKTTGVYRLGGGLSLESIYPVMQGYKDSAAVGARATFSDPLQFNQAVVTASYSPGAGLPARERVHLRGEYHRYDWTAHAAWNDADFYDLFGPTRTSRKGYSLGLAHTSTLVFDEPRRMSLSIGGRVAGNLDQLPGYQNVEVAVDRLVSMNTELTYSFIRSSLGKVDDEKGRTASAAIETDYANDALFTRFHATYDLGIALPVSHSSVWLRAAAGASPQSRDEPFANFYFGGFGNNYADHGEIKRFREYQGFPGAELNEISGRNFVRALVEWNLPPVRFRRAGTPAAYLSWLRPTLFAGGLLTNLDSRPDRRDTVTIGGQVDLRFTILSVLDLTLSAGAAVRMANGVPRRHEAMVSLAVLR